MSAATTSLLIAAALDGVAAVAHLGCIVFGAPWYHVFGAGERMAQMAERGDWRAAAVTAGIALMLATWAAYALSGAGVLPPLPLLWPALVAITAVLLLRAAVGLWLAASGRVRQRAFWWWSSAICLGYAVAHGLGLLQPWPP